MTPPVGTLKRNAFGTASLGAVILMLLAPFLDPIEEHFGFTIGPDELDHFLYAVGITGGIGAGVGGFRKLNDRKLRSAELAAGAGPQPPPPAAPAAAPAPAPAASRPAYQAPPVYRREPTPHFEPAPPPPTPPTPPTEELFRNTPPPYMRDCGIAMINYGSDPHKGNVIYGDDACLWVKAKDMDDFISGSLTNERGKRIQIEQASREGHNPNNPWPDTLRFELLMPGKGSAPYSHLPPGTYTLVITVDSRSQTDQFTLVPNKRPADQKVAVQ